jgi:hypothetical protein
MHDVKHLMTIQRDHNPQRKSTQQRFYTYHDISVPTHRWTRGLNGNHQNVLKFEPPPSVCDLGRLFLITGLCFDLNRPFPG